MRNYLKKMIEFINTLLLFIPCKVSQRVSNIKHLNKYFEFSQKKKLHLSSDY